MKRLIYRRLEKAGMKDIFLDYHMIGSSSNCSLRGRKSTRIRLLAYNHQIEEVIKQELIGSFFSVLGTCGITSDSKRRALSSSHDEMYLE